MTFIKKTSVLVTFLGLASSTPTAYSMIYRWVWDRLNAPPAPQTTKNPEEKPKPQKPKKVEPKKKEPTMQQVMEEVKEKNNYIGCGLLPGFSREKRTIWYVCSGGAKNSNKPTFYNYDKSKKGDERNRQVISISSSPSPWSVKFNKVLTERERLIPPFWLGKMGGQDLKPEENCQFLPRGGGKTSFELKCHDYTLPSAIDF